MSADRSASARTQDKKEETFAAVEGRHRRARQVPERRRQARRARHAVRHVRFPHARDAAVVGGAGARLQALHRHLHRGVRPRSRHVREQLSAGRRQLELRRAVECLQAPRRRLLGRREGEAVQRYGKARLPPDLQRTLADARQSLTGLRFVCNVSGANAAPVFEPRHLRPARLVQICGTDLSPSKGGRGR